jgi:isoquinoline 1-oxidoreductase beta subunit
MGQGVYTALPMLLAEELGADLAQIRIAFAPPGREYVNKLMGGHVTGASSSVRDAWSKLRLAGAQAREMLIAAAAARWKIQAVECRAENGFIVGPAGQSLKFGALAGEASKLPVPAEVALKAPANFRIIGTPRRRLDTPMKVDGSAVFGIDVRLPGMLFAALAQPPVLKGRFKSFDADKAKSMPGVRAVVPTSSGVAVVAETWWQARLARDALAIEWDAGPNGTLDDAAILSGLKMAARRPGMVIRKDGDAEAALAAAARVVHAEYELPLLAHATLEPQNCTADVRADGCDVYAPTQAQGSALAVAAAASGLPAEKVRINTTFLGGGFGRRLDVDFIPAAVEVSKAIGKPVKLLWTREDDTTHDPYRPRIVNTCAAALNGDGRLVAWQHHLTGPSITARVFPGAIPEGTPDPFSIEAAANYLYDVPNVLVDWVRHEIGIDVGYWRSVSHAPNCFSAETFMDELAAEARRDPVEFRLGLLDKQLRARAVLVRAAQEAGYGNAPKGRTHGVTLMEGYGTYMAQVVEISLERGRLQVHRIVCVLDCGQVVNPSIVTAQVEGSVIFGLTAALWGEINVKDGRVQQSNFDSYRLMRISEVPRIDTVILPSAEPPGGIGEPATALVAPAIGNAIFTATGRRIRSLPFAGHRLA